MPVLRFASSATRRKKLGVPASQSVGVARLVEPQPGELEDRLQHHEALAPPSQQALVDQRLDELGVAFGDGLDRLQRGAAREDGEPPEELLLLARQELVAPLDRRVQRPLPLGHVARARHEQRQALLESCEQRLGVEHLHPGGGQLDRERQPVEAPADLGGDRVVDLHVGDGPLTEELHGGRLGQRTQRVLALRRDPQRLATGHEQLSARARSHERCDIAGGVDDLLEVVEHEQRPPVAEERGRVALGADRARDRGEDERRIAKRRQVDEPDAVGERVPRLARRREREASLPDPAGTRERDDPRAVIREQAPDVGELHLAPDEGVRRHREIRLEQRPQARKLPVPELVDPLRLRQVLQAVQAEIDKQQVVTWSREAGGLLGDEHLPAVAGAHQPSRLVHVQTDVALVDDGRLTGVQADANADRHGLERVLCLACGGERVGRAAEGDEEGVTLGVDLDAAVARERVAQDTPVLGEQARVALAVLAEEPRRPFDVGEQERNRAGRQLTHPCSESRLATNV